MKIAIGDTVYGVYISHKKSEQPFELRTTTKASVEVGNLPAKIVLGEGTASCHVSDRFSRHRGVQIALARALKQAKLPKDVRAAVWDKVWNGKYANAK